MFPEQIVSYLSVIPYLLQQLAAYVTMAAMAVASAFTVPLLIKVAVVIVAAFVAYGLLKGLYSGFKSLFSSSKKEAESVLPPANMPSPYAIQPPAYTPRLYPELAALTIERRAPPPPYSPTDLAKIRPIRERAFIALKTDQQASDNKRPFDVIELDGIEPSMRDLADRINQGVVLNSVILTGKDGQQYALAARYNADGNNVTLCKRPLSPKAGEGTTVISKEESEQGWREQIASAFVDLAHQQQKQPGHSGFAYQNPLNTAAQVPMLKIYAKQPAPSVPPLEQSPSHVAHFQH